MGKNFTAKKNADGTYTVRSENGHFAGKLPALSEIVPPKSLAEKRGAPPMPTSVLVPSQTVQNFDSLCERVQKKRSKTEKAGEAEEAAVPENAKRVERLDIYETAAWEAAKRNADSITMPIKEEELTEDQKAKIENNAMRCGLTYEEVLQSVLTDKVSYLNVVGKATSRQNLPEKVFQKYVESTGAVECIDKLPDGGMDALYLIDGAIRSKRDGLTDEDITEAGVKSIDFVVKTKNGKVGYVTAKYTKEDGGHQDNQYHDVLTALKHFKPNKDFFFVANVDGPYYQKFRKKHGKSYFERMKELYANSGVLITTYETFGDDLGKM